MSNPKKKINQIYRKKKGIKPTYLREVQIKFRKKRVRTDLPVGKFVSDSKQIQRLFKDLENELKEKIITLHLDAQNKIMRFEVMGLGYLNAIYGRSREVFRSSFALNTYAAIVIHHPFRDPKPSKIDKTLTDKLSSLSENMGLKYYY